MCSSDLCVGFALPTISGFMLTQNRGSVPAPPCEAYGDLERDERPSGEDHIPQPLVTGRVRAVAVAGHPNGLGIVLTKIGTLVCHFQSPFSAISLSGSVRIISSCVCEKFRAGRAEPVPFSSRSRIAPARRASDPSWPHVPIGRMPGTPLALV